MSQTVLTFMVAFVCLVGLLMGDRLLLEELFRVTTDARG